MSLQIRTAQIRDDAITAAKVDFTDTFDFSSGTLRCGTPSGNTDVANKSYVDNVAVGLTWKEPVEVLNMKDDSDQSGADPTNPSTGDAWVVNNWLNQTDGDIVEWDGSQWNIVVANSGGEPPDGTRVLVKASGAGGSFTGQEDKFAVYDATGDSWSFDAATDGEAALIAGENSIYENQGYVYDTGSGWIQFAGPNLYTAGNGVDITSNVVSVKKNKGLTFSGPSFDTLEVLLDGSTGGLAFNGSNEVQVVTGNGLEIDGFNQVAIDLEPNAPGLEFSNGDLAVLLNPSKPCLTLAAAGLSVVCNATKGIVATANGVELQFAPLEEKTDWDGSTENTYTLAFTPLEDTNGRSPFLCVFYEGQKMREVAASPGQGEYTVSGKVVTFGFYPALNSVMVFEYIHQGT